jgi:hypothetical protein
MENLLTCGPLKSDETRRGAGIVVEKEEEEETKK